MGNPSFFYFHWFSHRIKIPSLAALEKTRLVLFPMYRHLQNTLAARDGWMERGEGEGKKVFEGGVGQTYLFDSFNLFVFCLG